MTRTDSTEDLEQRVAFESIRGRLFATSGQPVTIGRFVITGRLGHGGMGVVYAAYDPRLERKVAVKVMRSLGDQARATAARRSLEREARAAAALSHPNVVTVYDSGTLGDGVYVAMELVEGMTLREWLEVPRRWPEIVRMFLAAGRGLQAAHDIGLVHCDFKPDNVLVGNDGRPRVVDFGLARSRSQHPLTTVGSAHASMTGPSPLSGFSSVIGGTLPYMPPEQFQGEAEARSDQFAFCVALYRALFGAYPYRQPGGPLGREHERGRVPRSVVQAILVGLSREVGQRHRSMRALTDRLQRVLRRRARRPWLAATVLLLGGTAAGAYTLADVDPCEGATAALRTMWNDELRDEVTRSLTLAGAADQGERVAHRLQAHAQAWAAMRRESCEATQVHGVQSSELYELRSACLGRWQTTFQYTTEQLQQLVPGQATAASTLVEQLPAVDRCGAEPLRSSSLLQRGMAASRTDRSHSPQTNAAFEQIARWLIQARGERLLGTREQALALARQAEHLAHQMRLRYLEAESIMLRVAIELEASPSAHLEADLRRALSLAVEADDPDTAAMVVSRLLSLERLGAASVTDRAQLIALGHAWATRSWRAPTLHAWIDFERAHHALEQGEHEVALEVIGEARAALAASGEGQGMTAFELRIIEGRALLELGRLDEAELELSELLALMEAHLPEGHIDLADAAFYLATVRLERGDSEAALPPARLAATILRDRLGAEHDRTLLARLLVVQCLRKRGDFSTASAELEDLLTNIESSYGPHNVRSLFPLLEYVEVELGQGTWSSARTHATLAVTIATRDFGAEHPLTATCQLYLARTALDEGALDEAHALLHRARRRVDASFDRLAPAMSSYLLARIAWETTPPDMERAQSLADEASARLRDKRGKEASHLREQVDALRRRSNIARIQ